MKVYAKWNVNSYNIHFVTNGGDTIKDMSVKYGSDISNIKDKQIPVKDGYTFIGWYSDRKLSKIYEFKTMPANDITVYAGWAPVKTEFSFDSTGGNSVSDITVVYGEDGRTYKGRIYIYRMERKGRWYSFRYDN